MAAIKCKMCGGELSLTEGKTLAECSYCGTLQTVPCMDNERKLTLFERAERLRRNCEFDKAAGVYETIVSEFNQEPEAYWGLVLCKFGIEYVDDPATGKKVPTCHRSSFSSIFDDENFEQVLENADALSRKVYREEAKAIEEIRKGIIEVSAKEEPYDIFICYKETDAEGQRTLDSVLAQDLYDALTQKGYRVFFARITLEDKLGQEYEPYIFAALNSARAMLVVGTDYEHFNAVWVRNEWSRYLELIAKGDKKTLIPCYKGIDAYDMPKEFAKLQAQDLGKVGGIQDLLRGIDKVIQPAAAQPASSQNSVDSSRLLDLGNTALEEKNWKNAMNRFDLALVADPDCAEAYIGKLMAEKKLTKREALQKSKKRLDKYQNYREAMRCAGDSLRQELEDWNKKVKKAIIKRWIIRLAATACLFLIAWAALEITYKVTISNMNQGKITAADAYPVINAVKWYKGYPQELYLAALAAKDYTTAHQAEPKKLVLNAHTLATLGNQVVSNVIEQIVIEGNITQIPKFVFKNCKQLKEVTILDGVTSIEDNAFYGCKTLTNITIPNSVTSIGRSAFEGCVALANITIPDSVTNIGNYAFDGCTGLTAITIPDSVTSMGDYVFDGCITLTNVTISDSITSIGQSAFEGCVALTNITIPGSVTSIGTNAFNGCTGLTAITIPDSVVSIENFAFNGCTALWNITIPDSITNIGKCVFEGCTALANITIPNSVTSIGNNAFSDCTGLTAITIPASVQEMGVSVFEGCSLLQNIYCKAPEKPATWKSSWSYGCNATVTWGV